MAEPGLCFSLRKSAWVEVFQLGFSYAPSKNRKSRRDLGSSTIMQIEAVCFDGKLWRVMNWGEMTLSSLPNQLSSALAIHVRYLALMATLSKVLRQDCCFLERLPSSISRHLQSKAVFPFSTYCLDEPLREFLSLL